MHNRFGRVGKAMLALSAAGALLAGCAGGGASADRATGESARDSIAAMESVKFIVSEPFPAANSNNRGMKLFMDYVTEHTDGKVTFEVYDSGTLHPLPEAVKAIESGLSDITLYIPGLTAADIPGGAWASGLAAFTSSTPLDMLAGSPAAAAVWSSEQIRAEFEKVNAVYLGGFTSDSYTPLCTTPLKTLADAKGKLGRSSGGVYNAEIEALGMTPTLIPGPEVYEALQRGTVNCQVGALQNNTTLGLAEVAKYYTPLPFSPNTGPGYMMGKEKYDALPAAVQGIMHEASPLIGVGNNTHIVNEYINFYQNSKDKYGVTIVNPADDLTKALSDFRKAQGEKLVGKAPESISDPQALADQFQKVNNDWLKILKEEFGVPESDGSAESTQAALEHVQTKFDWDRYRARQYEYLSKLGIW